jgi:hypothetical protein
MALVIGGTTVTGTQTVLASTLTGTASAINGSNITNLTSGLTVADQWRVTTDFDGSVQPVINNWEQSDGTAQGNLGSSMANSSGVWTFPSTGFYYINFNCTARHDTAVRYLYVIIDATTDNSSYTDIAYGWGNIEPQSGDTYISPTAQTIVDVTNTTNVKVRFGTNTGVGGMHWNCGSAQNLFTATFIRLGDT